MIIEQVKGDSFTFQWTIDDDITDWKIRAVIYDCNGNRIDLATENADGSNDEVLITDAENGEFSIFIPAGATDNFAKKARFEIEVETDVLVGGVPEKKTVLQAEIKFKRQKIK